MKIDALTGAAVGFAAFAAWFVLKKKSNPAPYGYNGVIPLTAADVAYGMSRNQREQSGAAQPQNLDWILTGLTPQGFTPNVNGVPRTGTYQPFQG